MCVNLQRRLVKSASATLDCVVEVVPIFWGKWQKNTGGNRHPLPIPLTAAGVGFLAQISRGIIIKCGPICLETALNFRYTPCIIIDTYNILDLLPFKIYYHCQINMMSYIWTKEMFYESTLYNFIVKYWTYISTSLFCVYQLYWQLSVSGAMILGGSATNKPFFNWGGRERGAVWEKGCMTDKEIHLYLYWILY